MHAGEAAAGANGGVERSGAVAGEGSRARTFPMRVVGLSRGVFEDIQSGSPLCKYAKGGCSFTKLGIFFTVGTIYTKAAGACFLAPICKKAVFANPGQFSTN